MPTIVLSWEDWRRIIAVLRAKGLRYMLDHAARIELQLEEHSPGERVVALSLNDDIYLRSYSWARWQLGIPLAPTGD